MLSHRLLIALLVGWPALVCSLLAGRIVLGGPVAVPEYVTWLIVTGSAVVAGLMLMRRRQRRSAQFAGVARD